MTRAVAIAANIHANGLALPKLPEICEGNPKIPLPIMQLIVSAATLQRPIARISVGWRASGIGGLYHRTAGRTKSDGNPNPDHSCLDATTPHFPVNVYWH